MFSKIFKISSFFVVFFLMISSFSAKAQEKTEHFIYIQSEDTKQPFYVILNSKIYSSSSIGYLIIPKLKDGKYDIKLGFPRDIYPEQSFTFVINKADVGYSLHNKNDKEWSLLNLQTQEAISAGSTVAQSSDTTQSSAFGNMLSSATNDSTITQKTPEIVTKPIKDNSQKVQPEDSTATAQTDIEPPPPAATKTKKKKHTRTNDTDAGNTLPADTASTAEAAQDYNSGVVKSYERKGKTGTEMGFISYDNTNPDGDSVSILIPTKHKSQTPPKNKPEKLGALDSVEDSANNAAQPPVISNQDVADNVATGDKKKVSNPFFNKKNTENQADDNSNPSTPIANSAVNDDCTHPFPDWGMPALRKKMVAKNNDQDMIAVAKKILRGKCVTTDQIRSLGGLFLTDAGRYGLFEALYIQVYDIGNYPSLQRHLLDKYYVNRFKALVGE
jgi:hypothetical protein